MNNKCIQSCNRRSFHFYDTLQLYISAFFIQWYSWLWHHDIVWYSSTNISDEICPPYIVLQWTKLKKLQVIEKEKGYIRYAWYMKAQVGQWEMQALKGVTTPTPEEEQ